MMRLCLFLISNFGSKVVPVELADQLRQSLTSSDCRRCAGLLRMSPLKALFTTGFLAMHLDTNSHDEEPCRRSHCRRRMALPAPIRSERIRSRVTNPMASSVCRPDILKPNVTHLLHARGGVSEGDPLSCLYPPLT